jgi:hypothetical protein
LVEKSERLGDIEFNIQFTKKALAFIRSKGLKKPSIMINIDYTRTRCCITPRLVVDLADSVDAGENFLKIETSAGIPIYVRRELIDTAGGNKRSFDIDTTGSWRLERLRTKGFKSDMLTTAHRYPSL